MTPDDLLQFFGSPREAAAELGYTVQAINGWRRNGIIPTRAQQAIQTMTRGKLKAEKAA